MRPPQIIHIQEIEYSCQPWPAESMGLLLSSPVTAESSIVVVFKGVQRAARAELAVFSRIHTKSIVCIGGVPQELRRTNQSQIHICSLKANMCKLE